MKIIRIRLTILFLLTVFCCGLQVQKVEFTYDAAGNRTGSKTIAMLRVDTEEEEEEEDNPTDYTEVIAERIIRIYPNPTKGLLKIELENLSEGEKATVNLYSLSGQRILTREGVIASTELDITSQADGVYILRIMIGKEQSEWKVIKH